MLRERNGISGIHQRRLKKIEAAGSEEGRAVVRAYYSQSAFALIQHSPGFLDRSPCDGFHTQPPLLYTLDQFSQLDLEVSPGFNFPPISQERFGVKICPKICSASYIL